MTGLSLFSGIGGIDLAFEWAGGTVAAMVEVDTFCQKVLRKHWPDVPIFSDVREVKGADVGAVDVIYGGFPCQPFSVAGDRRGRDDERFLWPEFSRLVRELKPRWVVGENVPGILSLAGDEVCADLELAGYEVGIWDFEAAAVGAPHRRERVFFVAHAGRGMREGGAVERSIRGKSEVEEAASFERSGGTSSPDADGAGREEQRRPVAVKEKFGGAERCGGGKPQPGMGRAVDGLSPWMDGSWDRVVPRTAKGIPNRVARLKSLGNAVVPQQIYPIFRAIVKSEEESA